MTSVGEQVLAPASIDVRQHLNRPDRVATHISHRALLDDIICAMGVADSSDRAIAPKSEALQGMHLLYGVTGGIASVEAVRVARELRRHGAQLTVCMTQGAQRIISPLALEWASASPVLADWTAEMNQLDAFDGVVIAPSTRNFMARCALGILDEPLLMAISKALSTDTPVIMFPSMHQDLAADPQTLSLIESLTGKQVSIHWGPSEENKYKQMGAEMIGMVAANVINARRPNRQSVAITLGGTQGRIDPVRSITNQSTGRTGYNIAAAAFLNGHKVTTFEGRTHNLPVHSLWERAHVESAEEMSEAVLAIATSAKPPTLWVWSAAIQDYAPVSESMVKISSDQEQLSVQLIRVPKLIAVVQSHISEGARQIGFKLTAGFTVKQMLTAADSLRQSYQLSAVVANRVEDLQNGVRAHWVDASGSEAIPNSQNLTERISLFIEEA